ncbi:hypothetical protein P3T73_14580 [Kiritimatiellota bacterium B12222]|nr:hypothetical protein P3T73_14580 [Kiritimatiellota bacterium B12222]
MKIRLILGCLGLLLLSSCYRPSTKNLVLVLPETEGNPQELELLRQELLSEQERLRDEILFYKEIIVHPEASCLEITYYRRHLADMNVIMKLNNLGYTVNSLPGDDAKRDAFRQTHQLSE